MQHKKLGLVMLTTLVAGNMIGSGIFLLPADLARIGSISLLSWGITAAGAFLLAIIFAKMSLLIPKTGGPYAYAQAAFGDFIGFQTAYTYWAATWIGNSAIAISTVGYLAIFWPILHQASPSCALAITILWVLTCINILGVRSAGTTQVITTILKFIPIFLVIFFGWAHIHLKYLVDGFNVTHLPVSHAISKAATLTLWSFIGLESATVPAASVENPTRNIPLATLLGTLIAAVVYISSSTAIMGMLPNKILAASSSPFALAASVIFGHWGKWLIGAGAAISCFGALNGWVLLQGQIAMAAADNNLFPAIFAKRNRFNVPGWGIAITSMLISVLLLLSRNSNLVEEFHLIILVAVTATLIAYLYTTMAEIIILKRTGKIALKEKLFIGIAILAGIYACWAIFSAGELIIYYLMGLLVLSLPLYAWLK